MFSSVTQSLFGNAVTLAKLEKSFWLPEPNSNFAGSSDGLFYFILWISVVSFVGIVATMLYFMWKYRARPGVEPQESPSHNTALELTWSAIPAAFMLVLFVWGFVGFADIQTVPEGCYEIEVTAKQWSWEFKYPNGAVNEHLHIEVGRPVRLVMKSRDVIHSLSIPAFRVKQDILPKRYTKMWFQAIETGNFPLYCTEFCGDEHSKMLARVVVHPSTVKGDLTQDQMLDTLDENDLPFDAWLVYAADIRRQKKYFVKGVYSPEKAGEGLYKGRGCISCHSVDGTKKVGPSFAGSFGTQIPIEGQSETVLMDENYILDSLQFPRSQIHKGFPSSMPSYSGGLTEHDVKAIVAYIKSLKDKK